MAYLFESIQANNICTSVTKIFRSGISHASESYQAMSAMLFSEWRKLPVSLTELCLDTTLRCGQSFRWKQFGEGGEWRCSMGGRVLSLKQDSTYLHYRAIWPSHKHVLQKTELRKEQCLLEEHEDDTESLIKNYFNLGPRLSTLYE